MAMRRAGFTCTILAAAALVAAGQSLDSKQAAALRQLFPAASSFSAKGGEPPHFTAFAGDPRTGVSTPVGFAFWTTELTPLERGYDGPIKILVGMDTAGVLTGVIVVDHHEPYGYFSVDKPEFPAQFKGKSIQDPFRVGDDIDAISRATMSVTSSTRAIRDSARRVARKLLSPPPKP
jgi:NosR/NirI family nitrous oxide reductase transcriptional regulator